MLGLQGLDSPLNYLFVKYCPDSLNYGRFKVFSIGCRLDCEVTQSYA